MAPGNLFSVLLGVLPLPVFGGGGAAVDCGVGLGEAVVFGWDFPSDDVLAPFSPFF